MTVRNTFSPNTTIESAKVNQNFADIDGYFVDGWFPISEAHTRNDTNKINVPAGGLLKYSVGDKYKCTQSIPLTSYWNMDGNSTDTKGSNNGTDTNISYTATGTKFTQHAVFNGTSSAIAITDAANLKPTGAFTIGGWFKTSTTAKTIFQSYSDNTNSNGFTIQISSNCLAIFIGNNAADPTSSVVGTTSVVDGNWHYFVISSQGNFTKIFLDGNLEASGYTVTPSYAATNYVRIGCGCLSGANTTFFNGAIDDLFLINGFAVDKAWVAAKYAEGTAQTNANITATQYFYVTTVADQLLTVTGGADYVLYNATISSPYYSKATSPVGFPADSNTFSPIGVNYAQITSGTTTASGSAVAVSGLSIATNSTRRIKITVYIPSLYNDTAGNAASVSLWAGTVGSGTQINYAKVYCGSSNAFAPATLTAIVTPNGAVTYNVGLNREGGAGNAGITAAATTPAYIFTEIV